MVCKIFFARNSPIFRKRHGAEDGKKPGNAKRCTIYVSKRTKKKRKKKITLVFLNIINKTSREIHGKCIGNQ